MIKEKKTKTEKKRREEQQIDSFELDDGE